MDVSDLVMRKAVGLASSGINLRAARDALLAETAGDRLALEVARANILRDGLPRCRPASPRSRDGRPIGSLRNRTLNLLEYALAQNSMQLAGEGAPPAPYAWSEMHFDTWD